MEPLIVALLVGLGVYIVTVALMPKRMLSKTSEYTQNSLDALEESYAPGKSSVSILRERTRDESLLLRSFLLLPGARSAYAKMIRAGMENSADAFFISMILVLLLATYLLKSLGIIALPAAALLTVLIGRWYVNRRIEKRNAAFLNIFPDALDMIVRSLRSGYPLNSAVRMVADSMDSPVKEEFKQVADETAYGSALVESLKRLSNRIDEPDIRFFVVVLAVQQDVGGNLAEVLSNLSSIIRKRKHLRLKIKALTSEGVAAAWVLGMLPLFEFIMIRIFSPAHLEPFFTTHLGNMLLAGAIGIVVLGMVIVRKMINIDV